MNRKLLSFMLFIQIIFLIFIPLSFATNIENDNFIKIDNNDDWYYLPGYPNYSPKGIPDFDQRQDSTWRTTFSWAFCGPAALANIIWWFDSKNSDSNGYAGDGVDNYPLVKNYYPV